MANTVIVKRSVNFEGIEVVSTTTGIRGTRAEYPSDKCNVYHQAKAVYWETHSDGSYMEYPVVQTYHKGEEIPMFGYFYKYDPQYDITLEGYVNETVSQGKVMWADTYAKGTFGTYLIVTEQTLTAHSVIDFDPNHNWQ